MDQFNTEHFMNLPADYFDTQVKRFFSQKLVIAHIAKAVITEYAHMSIEDILAHLDREHPNSARYVISSNTELTDIKGKTIRPDIVFLTTPPGSKYRIPIVINLEPQNKPNPGYPLVSRGIYYVGRLLSIQEHGENMEALYNTLHKVYSIWICYNAGKIPEEEKNSIISYEIAERVHCGRPRRAAKSEYDKAQIWMITLGNYADAEPESLLRMLDIAFSNDDKLAEDEKFTIFENEYKIKDPKFVQEVKELNAYVLDYAKLREEKALEKNNLEWEAKLSQTKAEAAKKDALVQKLLMAKRYVDLENMYKDPNLQKKLLLEFGF